MTPPHAGQCAGCALAFFPPRLRCHACGSTSFTPLPVALATVAAVCHVHRQPPGSRHSHLVEVHGEGGLRLLAAANSAPTIGTQVRLTQAADGAIGILTTSPKETP